MRQRKRRPPLPRSRSRRRSPNSRSRSRHRMTRMMLRMPSRAKLQSVEKSLIKAKRSRKLFDRETRAFNSESLAAFQGVVFELAPIDEPFLGAWMMSSEQHCNCTTTELFERQRLVQARALRACGSRMNAHHSAYECP